jgi:hypothetical protein
MPKPKLKELTQPDRSLNHAPKKTCRNHKNMKRMKISEKERKQAEKEENKQKRTKHSMK